MERIGPFIALTAPKYEWMKTLFLIIKSLISSLLLDDEISSTTACTCM